MSWTITQPIELTISRFPGLFRLNPTHKLSRNSMKKTSKENSRSQSFYDSSRSRLLSTHVLITLFGSPSPNLVVLLNVAKLCGAGLVKLSYNRTKRQILENLVFSIRFTGTKNIPQIPNFPLWEFKRNWRFNCSFNRAENSLPNTFCYGICWQLTQGKQVFTLHVT